MTGHHLRTNRSVALVGLFVLGLSSLASGQSRPRGEPDVSKAHVRIGRLLLNPTIALTNVGIDTNVFNEPDQSVPKEDFTLTLTPQSDLWLRIGRTWVTGNIREDLVWYKTFESERSGNDSAKLGWLVPLNRFVFNADAAYLSTRDRQGFEIDARSQREEQAYQGGAEIRVLPKTFVGARGERTTTRYDHGETFDGVSLSDALNRTATGASVSVRLQVTPLTGITFDLGHLEERFESSPLRDADSTSAVLGVKLDPFALVKGGATVGYRDFRPHSADVPAYQGAIASADLTYLPFGETRLGLQATRDIDYSYDVEQPYYLLTGLSGSLEQHVVGPLEAAARIGRQRLNYRQSTAAVDAAPTRVDSVVSYGGSIGYRIGNDVRIGFNVDQQHRTSPVENREYHGLRYGASVTYGR